VDQLFAKLCQGKASFEGHGHRTHLQGCEKSYTPGRPGLGQNRDAIPRRYSAVTQAIGQQTDLGAQLAVTEGSAPNPALRDGGPIAS